jgi:hypothetical protein
MGFLQVVPSTSPLNRNLFSQILHFMLKFCPLMLTVINSNVLWGPCVCVCAMCVLWAESESKDGAPHIVY